MSSDERKPGVPVQRTDGKRRWRYRIPVGTKDWAWSASFDTERKAVHDRLQYLTGRHPKAILARTGKEVPTLMEMFEVWRAMKTGAAPERIETDRQLARVNFGKLGSTPVNEITHVDVGLWVADLSTRLQPSTVSKVLSLARAGLRVSVAQGLILGNPAEGISGQTVKRHKLDATDVLTADELNLLIPIVQPPFRALVAFRGYIGTRWSETIAIRVRDLDMLRKKVRVGHRAVVEQKGPMYIRESGKTENAERTIPMPKLVVDLLAEHLARYPTNRDGLVFRSEQGGLLSRHNFRRRVWNPSMEKLGAKLIADAKRSEDRAAIQNAEIRAKELRAIVPMHMRHTAASLMLSEGVPPLDAAWRLGHANPYLLLATYARLLPNTSTEDSYGLSVTERYEKGLLDQAALKQGLLDWARDESRS